MRIVNRNFTYDTLPLIHEYECVETASFDSAENQKYPGYYTRLN